MKIEDYINDVIDKEKQVQPNPFLSTRIMARLESETPREAKRIPAWQKLAVAASLGLVVMMGVGIGNTRYSNSNTSSSLNINDSQIEGLNYYIAMDYE